MYGEWIQLFLPINLKKKEEKNAENVAGVDWPIKSDRRVKIRDVVETRNVTFQEELLIVHDILECLKLLQSGPPKKISLEDKVLRVKIAQYLLDNY